MNRGFTGNGAVYINVCNNEGSGAVLKVKRVWEGAKLPVRGSEQAAGLDLFAAEEKVIPAQGKGVVSTGIAVELPVGVYGRVAPRSGLAVKSFIDVGAGVIDRDYRGIVGVVLFNFSLKEFVVKKGDRIAQLLLEKIEEPVVVECGELGGTGRGEHGFGSTGLREQKKKSEGVDDQVKTPVEGKPLVGEENHIKGVLACDSALEDAEKENKR